MKNLRRMTLGLLCGASLLLPTAAFSAELEVSGVASKLSLNTSSADTGARGSVSVTVPNGIFLVYWGNSECAAYAQPTSAQIEALTHAVVAKLPIRVRYKGSNCLVGFSIG
ncbi:hypothetical protein [Sorangium sp. So ce1000]|uniref:hypothetical protein n=1 Tax=Sorangium sp. So ce1000 TaxID=3133325 RepID=UPI003F5D7872